MTDEHVIGVGVQYDVSGVQDVKSASDQVNASLNANKATMAEFQKQVTLTNSAMDQMASGKIKDTAMNVPPMGTKAYNEWATAINKTAAENDALAASIKNTPAGPGSPGSPVNTENANQAARSVANLTSEFRGLRFAAQGLQQLGMLLTIGGGLLTAGLVADANNYVKAMGQTTELSSQWLASEKQIKEASLQIGQTTASVMLPALQAGADVLSRIAQFVQANPWIVQAALGVGTAMIVVGTTAMIVGRLVAVIADFGLALSRLGLLQAQATMNQLGGVGTAEYMPGVAGSIAASQAGAAGIGSILSVATITVGSLILGAMAGVDLGNWINKQLQGKDFQAQNFQDAMMTAAKLFQLPWVGWAHILAGIDPQLTSTMNKFIEFINRIDKSVGGLIGASKYQTPVASASEPNQYQATEVQDFISFQKQINDAQANYSQQRADTIKQYEQQVVDTTAQYESQRANIISSSADQLAKMSENFNNQTVIAQRNYNEQVAKSNRDFSISQMNAAKTHQLEIQKLEAQHNARMSDLAASRDALGLVKENQSYKQSLSQSQEQFNLQRTQAAQQHAIQISDQKAAFEQQRQDALDAYNRSVSDANNQETQQLARLDAQHKLEMDKLAAQEKDKLAKLDDAYKKQVDQLQTAFIDRINALTSSILGDTAAYTRYMEQETQQFQAWLEKMTSKSAATLSGTGTSISATGSAIIGSRAVGGYASFFGPGENGKPEYVLNNSTTTTLENVLGGKLSQANLLASVLAGRNMIRGAGTSGNNMNITLTSRSLTVSEVRAEVKSALGDLMADIIPSFGAS